MKYYLISPVPLSMVDVKEKIRRDRHSAIFSNVLNDYFNIVGYANAIIAAHIYSVNHETNEVIKIDSTHIEYGWLERPSIVLFLIRLFGITTFSFNQINFVVQRLCNRRYDDLFSSATTDDVIFSHIINAFDDWDYQIYQTGTCVRQLLFKYRHKLRNDKHHWISTLPRSHNGYGNMTYADILLKSVPIDVTDPIYGYKAFYKKGDNNLLRCRDYTFNITQDHHIDYAAPCVSGFHFCKKKVDIHKFYTLSDSSVVVYKVQAWGEVLTDGTKSVCTDLRILNKVRKPPRF